MSSQSCLQVGSIEERRLYLLLLIKYKCNSIRNSNPRYRQCSIPQQNTQTWHINSELSIQSTTYVPSEATRRWEIGDLLSALQRESGRCLGSEGD